MNDVTDMAVTVRGRQKQRLRKQINAFKAALKTLHETRNGKVARKWPVQIVGNAVVPPFGCTKALSDRIR